MQLPALGGDERDRTDDPLLAKQVLSQLSYTPIFFIKGAPFFSSEKSVFALRLQQDPQN